jgi:MoaA/NifB/PqqE/SkfB family radical SAM enzyme
VAYDRRDFGLALVDTVERALAEDRLSPQTMDRAFKVLVSEAMIGQGDQAAKSEFREHHGQDPPSFLVISPGKGCNLRCKGCYAASNRELINLPWEVFDKLITQVHDLWGGRFIVISGGEPLMYRDQGKGLLDMAEAHPEMFFMFYTNGTLISSSVAERMSKLGNIMPAISVEGLGEETDARRGEGVFDRILNAFANLRKHKVLFGLSMTATKDNTPILLSDEVIDFYFQEQGVFFTWVFHYMPIGRDYTLDLMPTPAQRHNLYEQAWKQIREKKVFIADFWNSGTLVNGCISSGRSGGYFYVDWNGNMSPCVFVPYSPLNVNDLFAQGKTINDAWEHPFFADLRQWQKKYGCQPGPMPEDCGNWLTPCPIRDHYAAFRAILEGNNPIPIDPDAAAALYDDGYREGLIRFDKALREEMDPIWEQKYLSERQEI